MKTVSLKAVCAVVVLGTTSAFLANADEAPKQPTVEKATTVATKAVTFEQLLKTNDSDNNGLLSQKELENILDTGLLKAFNDIDSNDDQAISADEFAKYTDMLAKK